MDLALGTVAYTRRNKLENLLESCIGQPVSKVYIFDNGDETDEKRELYNRDFPFEVKVTQSETNRGPNYGRHHIAKECTEDYLMIVDSDNELLGEITILAEQLKNRPNLGGVSGILLEYGKMKGPFHDLYKNNGLLIRGIKDRKEVETIAGSQFIPFDFLPQCTLFRKECVKDYSWDPEYGVGKGHLDFYIGHKERTDWQFGVCPEVLIKHNPGGDRSYGALHGDWEDKIENKRYLLDKWGFSQVVWEDYYSISLCHNRKLVSKYVISNFPPRVQKLIMDTFDTVRKSTFFKGKRIKRYEK